MAVPVVIYARFLSTWDNENFRKLLIGQRPARREPLTYWIVVPDTPRRDAGIRAQFVPKEPSVLAV